MKRSMVCLTVLLLFGVNSLAAQCLRFGPIEWGECDHDHDPDPVVEFGVRGGYDFEDEVGSAGAQLRIPFARQILFVPSGDVFFDDARTQWQLNADVLLRPDALGGLYAGAGAAFVSRDFEAGGDQETQVGYNLLVGLDGHRIGDTRVRPFVEARWTDVDDYSPFRLVTGINVPVSGGR